MRFKEYLTENVFKSDEEIIDWVKTHNIASHWLHNPHLNISVNHDKSIDIDEFEISQGPEIVELTELPIKFGKVAVACVLSNMSKMNSLVGLPHTCTHLMLAHTGLKSLVGIADIVKRAKTIDIEGCDIASGGIGLLLIEGLTEVICQFSIQEIKIPAALDIIRKYLGRPEDIYECQAELIENGLEEYAIL